MEWAAASGFTQHQATRTVFVIGVVLNDLAARDSLPQLGDRDSPLNALIERVLRKFERPACDFRSNSIGQVHVMNRIKTESSRQLAPYWEIKSIGTDGSLVAKAGSFDAQTPKCGMASGGQGNLGREPVIADRVLGSLACKPSPLPSKTQGLHCYWTHNPIRSTCQIKITTYLLLSMDIPIRCPTRSLRGGALTQLHTTQ